VRVLTLITQMARFNQANPGVYLLIISLVIIGLQWKGGSGLKDNRYIAYERSVQDDWHCPFRPIRYCVIKGYGSGRYVHGKEPIEAE